MTETSKLAAEGDEGCRHSRRERRIVGRPGRYPPAVAWQCADCGAVEDILYRLRVSGDLPLASPEDAERCRPVDWDRWYAGSRRQGPEPTPTEEMAVVMYEECQRRHASKTMAAALMDLMWTGLIDFDDAATGKLHHNAPRVWIFDGETDLDIILRNNDDGAAETKH